MSILGLLLVLVIVGVCLYLLNLIPIDPTMRLVIRIVVILLVVIWLLETVGLFTSGPVFRIR